MTPHVPEFEVALAANDFEAIDALWKKLLETYGDNADVFLDLAAKLADKRERRRAATLLGQAMASLKNAGNYEGAYKIVQALVEYNPAESGLWEELTEIVRHVMQELPDVEEILKEGQTKFGGQIRQFLEFLQMFTTFKPGDFIYHANGWGIGRVTAANPAARKITVDFYETKAAADGEGNEYVVGKAAHQFGLEVAKRVVVRLDPEHINAWKVLRMAELRGLCSSDPVAVLKIVARGNGGSTTQKDLKAGLVPDVMTPKTWTKFLTRLKKLAAKDTMVKLGTGANPTIKLLSRVESHDERLMSTIAKPVGWEKRIELSREALSADAEKAPTAETMRELATYWKDRLNNENAFDHAENIAAACFLAEAHDKLKDEAFIAPRQLDADWFNSIDNERFVVLLHELPAAYQKRLLGHAREWGGDHFATLLTECFMGESQTLWDEAMRIVESDKKLEPAFDTAFELLSASPDRAPDSYIWTTRHYFNHAPRDAEHDQVRYQMFEKMIALSNRLQHEIDRGEKEFKSSLTRIKNALSEKQYAMISILCEVMTLGQATQVYHHVSTCRGISDVLRRRLHVDLEEKFPEVARTAEGEDEAKLIDDKYIWVTELGYARHQRRLSEIMNTDLPDVAKAIGEALALGDISENAELDAAREKESRLKHAAAKIQEELEKAKLINPNEVNTEIVGLGTRVRLTNLETGDTLNYTIVGPWDVDTDRGLISYRTAIAEAMLGKPVGTEVKIVRPAGTLPVRIEDISNGLAEFAQAANAK